MSELVETNRQLETKLIIMEGYIEGNDSLVNSINYFVLLQHRMEELVNFLLERNLISNSDEYNRFIFSSRRSLTNYDYEEYFSLWAELMKNLFSSVNEKQSE